jgi:hypothetical protein
MDDRTVRGARLLRGLALAGLSTLLVGVGHVLAGGAVPDLGLLLVLLPLLTGVVVGLAERCRTLWATVATLAAGQYALHVLLGLLHTHAPVAPGPGGATMLALHAVATLLVAALLRTADRGLAAVAAAAHRVLPRRPFVPPADGPLPSLRVTGPARPLLRTVVAAAPARRGPPVGC